MESAAFWTLVDRSRQEAPDDLDDQYEKLKELLAELPADEVLSFHSAFVDANLALYTWDLWAAATVMLGWCSDDVFTDFRSWVISRGRETYLRVAADPDALADVELDDPDEIGDGETFAGAAGEVYEEATGHD